VNSINKCINVTTDATYTLKSAPSRSSSQICLSGTVFDGRDHDCDRNSNISSRMKRGRKPNNCLLSASLRHVSKKASSADPSMCGNMDGPNDDNGNGGDTHVTNGFTDICDQFNRAPIIFNDHTMI
jgi:hypothetical protein